MGKKNTNEINSALPPQALQYTLRRLKEKENFCSVDAINTLSQPTY